MTVERLAVAVLLCAALEVAGAGAQDMGTPISVAVPPTSRAPASPNPAQTSETARENGAEASAPTAQTPQAVAVPPKGEVPPKPDAAEGEDEANMGPAAPDAFSPAGVETEEAQPAEQPDAPPAAVGADPALDEEYMPLDLPPETNGATGQEEAEGEPPGVEPAVLGLDPEAPAAVFFVHAEILGVPNGEGVVAASLCTRKNFTKSGCRTERVTARQDRVSVTFDNVAPGTYAVQVHHDQNDNGKMDFTFFGLPKEPYGFSRDAKPMLAPPKFDAASFEVTGGDVSLVINLQNT